MTPANKGSKMSDAQRAKLSKAMKASYAERRKRYGGTPPGAGKGRTPGYKWTKQQRANYNAAVAAKRKAREAAANGSGAVVPHVMEIPLDAIPERATPRSYVRRATRMNGAASDNQELATDLLRIAVALLKGKL